MNGEARLDKKDEKRKIIIFLIIGVVLIIGLSVVNIVVLLNKGNRRSQNGEEQTGIQAEIEEIRTKINENIVMNSEKVIEICKGYLESSSGERKAALLAECARQIMSYDVEAKYRVEVTDYLTEADNIEQSIGSAIDVINAAAFYDDEKLISVYQELVNCREKEEGIDLNIEGEG